MTSERNEWNPLDANVLAEAVQQLQALRSLMTTLNEDILRFRTISDGPERRALVRSVFAYVEGTSFAFRSAAFYLARMRNVRLEVGEMMMAREITYALNEKGQVEEKLAISSPLANVRFALAIFAKVGGAPYEFPAGDENFENLQRAQRIRNRLTHPRGIQDLEVTDEEQALVVRAGEWVGEQQTKVLTAFAFRLYSGLDHFHSQLMTLPKTESGGYSAEVIGQHLTEGLTNSQPVSIVEISQWFAKLLEERKSKGVEE